eukprot:358674-Chlamydomonas_euryale.AAC.2
MPFRGRYHNPPTNRVRESGSESQGADPLGYACVKRSKQSKITCKVSALRNGGAGRGRPPPDAQTQGKLGGLLRLQSLQAGYGLVCAAAITVMSCFHERPSRPARLRPYECTMARRCSLVLFGCSAVPSAGAAVDP